MAEVNGCVQENKIKTEDTKTEDVKPEAGLEKADVNGGGDNASNVATDDKKSEEVKMDPELRAKKIKRQIEYYFGDYNLPTDKFLREQVKQNDGWVTLETLLKFKRLASLTQDSAVIVDALTGSDLVQIKEDKTALRRHPDKPLPEENEARRKEVLLRSVYVKGFPQEGFTIDNALDFFEEYGPADDVVMRFWQDKAAKTWKFKGSVFVKYPTKEAAAAFIALEDVKYKDTPLVRIWQEDYIEQKRKERLEIKLNKRKHSETEDNKGKPENDKGLPKDATLHMTKCPSNLTREVLKEKLEEEMGVTVAFIDFNKGDEEGWIRLHEEGTAAKVMENCEGGILKVSDGVEVEVKPLEGEEETAFLEKAKQTIIDRRSKGNRQQRGRRGGGRGGRGGGNWRKRRNEASSDEPQAKVKKTVDSDDGE